MKASDKRQGGSGSNAHVHRNPSSASMASTHSARNSIIAPPPRAAVSSSSSSTAGVEDGSTGLDGAASGNGIGPGAASGAGSGAGSGGGSSRNKDSSSIMSSASSVSSGRTGSVNTNAASSVVASLATASAAATAALLKDKDDRIAYLEREMTTMETEFQRELDKLSQNESETATFWQAKHSVLNQQFLRTDTELRLLRAELDVREAEREELRDGWEVLRREVRERDREIADLKGQVRGLKEWVSTSTRTDDQTSDEVFGDGMARLGNGLQNWVIVNFRRAKLDVSKTTEATKQELAGLVPMYEELAYTAKVHLLQSIVSRILVQDIFSSYYVGISSDQAAQFLEMESLLTTFAGSAEAVNQWRAATLSLLKRDASQIMQAETTRVADEALRRVNRILGAITDTKATEPRDQALQSLITSAIALARLLAAQKAVFHVAMPEILPHQKILFDPATMEDIGGEDEEALAQREICCVTLPGITKIGDESGGHLHFSNVIAKARVLCSPE